MADQSPQSPYRQAYPPPPYWMPPQGYMQPPPQHAPSSARSNAPKIKIASVKMAWSPRDDEGQTADLKYVHRTSIRETTEDGKIMTVSQMSRKVMEMTPHWLIQVAKYIDKVRQDDKGAVLVSYGSGYATLVLLNGAEPPKDMNKIDRVAVDVVIANSNLEDLSRFEEYGVINPGDSIWEHYMVGIDEYEQGATIYLMPSQKNITALGPWEEGSEDKKVFRLEMHEDSPDPRTERCHDLEKFLQTGVRPPKKSKTVRKRATSGAKSAARTEESKDDKAEPAEEAKKKKPPEDKSVSEDTAAAKESTAKATKDAHEKETPAKAKKSVSEDTAAKKPTAKATKDTHEKEAPAKAKGSVSEDTAAKKPTAKATKKSTTKDAPAKEPSEKATKKKVSSQEKGSEAVEATKKKKKPSKETPKEPAAKRKTPPKPTSDDEEEDEEAEPSPATTATEEVTPEESRAFEFNPREVRILVKAYEGKLTSHDTNADTSVGNLTKKDIKEATRIMRQLEHGLEEEKDMVSEEEEQDDEVEENEKSSNEESAEDEEKAAASAARSDKQKSSDDEEESDAPKTKKKEKGTDEDLAKRMVEISKKNRKMVEISRVGHVSTASPLKKADKSKEAPETLEKPKKRRGRPPGSKNKKKKPDEKSSDKKASSSKPTEEKSTEEKKKKRKKTPSEDPGTPQSKKKRDSSHHQPSSESKRKKRTTAKPVNEGNEGSDSCLEI